MADNTTREIQQGSWSDVITFRTFLRNKVRATANQEDGKLVVTYYCDNPIVDGVLTVRYAVDAEDNPLVNLDLIVEMMQNATSELYQAVSDKDGIITPLNVIMRYSECYDNVPLLEHEIIK